jgi:hypothetical protein
MNLEFEDDHTVEIRFTERGLRRLYKGPISVFFEKHTVPTVRVEEIKLLNSGVEEPRRESLLRVVWNWWRPAQSEFHYRETGHVDLGDLSS